MIVVIGRTQFHVQKTIVIRQVHTLKPERERLQFPIRSTKCVYLGSEVTPNIDITVKVKIVFSESYGQRFASWNLSMFYQQQSNFKSIILIF